MDEIGQKGVGFYSLYNVLNGLPNRNRLTTFTGIIHIQINNNICIH